MKKGWQTKRFEEVIEIRNGKGQREVESASGKYPIYGSAGSKMGFATDYICEAGTTIIGRKGTINNPVYINERFWNVDTAFGLSPKDELDSKFLHYFCLSYDFSSHNRGTTIPSLVKTDLLQIPMPVPPREEQQRIVKTLDEALAGIATAKANAEKNLQNARALFESHLQSVFTRRGNEWIEDKLQALTTKIGSGATPLGGEAAYKSKGVSLVRSLNVYDMGFRYEKLAFLDDEQAEGLSNVVLQKRDVLLNITGASVARCCIVPEDILPARVNQHVSIIRPIPEKLDAEFLHYLLISKPYKDRLLQTGEDGGSTRQAITKAQIQEFKVAHPKTIVEQKQIVAQLDTLANETQRLGKIYERKLAALEELKKSLLHQAFTGNLLTSHE